MRSFKQADGLIYVDDQILQKIAQFLKAQQAENGEFAEHGEVHHKAMQVQFIAPVICAGEDAEALHLLGSRLW